MLSLLGFVVGFVAVFGGEDPCNWVVDPYYNGGGVEYGGTGIRKIPFDTCLTPLVNMEDDRTWKSYMWTFENEDEDNGNYTVVQRWVWNDTSCDNDDYKMLSCLASRDDPGSCDARKYYLDQSGSCQSSRDNFTATFIYWDDYYTPEESDCSHPVYWHLGGQDCHVRVQEYFPSQYDGDLDETKMCEGLTKASANYTQTMYVMNENCTRGDIIRCNENATRVTMEATPHPDCDAEPWETYRSWYNYEGGCYEISCAADNRTSPLDFQDPRPSDYQECKYVTIWDSSPSETYALDQCGNSYDSDSEVASQLFTFTYSYKYECNDDETAVNLVHFPLPNCAGTRYITNYYTKDSAAFSCGGGTNRDCFSTFTYYYDTDLDCGGDENVDVFGPHEYEDNVYAMGECFRTDDDPDDASSYFLLCEDDTLKQWEWNDAYCNTTVVSYTEKKTGCNDGSYQEISCGSVPDVEFNLGASGRAVMSWTALIAVGSGLIWFSL